MKLSLSEIHIEIEKKLQYNIHITLTLYSDYINHG